MFTRTSHLAWSAGLASLVALALTQPVFAHAGHEHSSFSTGFAHPLGGLDHLLAMVTVGLLSARMEPKRMWTLPLAFVAMMAAGGVLGVFWASEGVLALEWGISLSVLVFGLVAAAAPSVPVVGGNLLVAAFAVCHGHAHAAEMGDASAWGYFPGMLLSTASLHLVGLAVGVAMQRQIGEWSIRAAGAAVAVGFAALLVAALLP
ncbi:MAG: HupE/UreJ family protein [Phycisphaeraceae bacterium]